MPTWAASPAGLRLKAEKGRVQYHAGHERSGRAAAGAIGAREPLVEWQQAEFCAEADDEQYADRDLDRRGTASSRHGRMRRTTGPAQAPTSSRIATSSAIEPTSSMPSMNRTGAARIALPGARSGSWPRRPGSSSPRPPERTPPCWMPNTPSAPSRLHGRAEQPPGAAVRAGRRQQAGERCRHQAEPHQPQRRRRHLERRMPRRPSAGALRQRRFRPAKWRSRRRCPPGSPSRAASVPNRAGRPSQRERRRRRSTVSPRRPGVHSANASSLHTLRHAVEEHQQRLDDRGRVRRTTGQINVDGQHALQAVCRRRNRRPRRRRKQRRCRPPSPSAAAASPHRWSRSGASIACVTGPVTSSRSAKRGEGVKKMPSRCRL